MKKSLLIIFLLLITSLLSAQSMGYYESISFDPPNPIYISINVPDSTIFKIDTSVAGNIWQIGKPHKTIFDSAYSRPDAIVTDTIHDYPANNLSTFAIKIFDPTWTGFYPSDEDDISFKHKFDTDSLQDGGYVEISYNNGTTWTNIANDTIGWWNPYFYNQNNYPNPIIANGNAAFTGRSNGWLKTDIAGCNINILLNPNPVYLRFVFSSGSIPTNKEGWIIDNISICLGCGSCLGIKEEQNNESISIFPNPVNDELAIEAPQKSEIVILNIEGQIIKTIFSEDKLTSLDMTDLSSGVYIVTIKTGKEIVTKKIIKE